ncbi:unnamed protein product, partial [Tilletia caries]
EGRARDGITKLQEMVEPKLRQWRLSMWKEEWSKLDAPSWLGVSFYMRVEDIADVVRNLGKIDRGLTAEEDGFVERFVAMEAKSLVVPQLTAKLKEIIAEFDADKEKARQEKQAAADQARRERAKDKASKHAARKSAAQTSRADNAGEGSSHQVQELPRKDRNSFNEPRSGCIQ